MSEQNRLLQEYYINYLENEPYKQWKERCSFWTEVINEIKKVLIENISIEDLDNLFIQKQIEIKNKILLENPNFKIENEAEFIHQYLFKKENGIAGGGQGLISNKDREVIKNKQDLGNVLCRIINIDSIEDADKEIAELINVNSKYKLIKNRFLAVLFPSQMTTIANEGDFNTLKKNLKNKISFNFENRDYINSNKYLMEMDLKNEDGTDATDYDKQIFYWWLHVKLKDNLSLKKAVVYYGAPGTGKTFRAKQEAKEYINSWKIQNDNLIEIDDEKNLLEITQFHPSFSYEDFIEGIRPTKAKELKVQNGIFKKFCKRAAKIELDLLNDPTFQIAFKDINYDLEVICLNDVSEMNSVLEIFKHNGINIEINKVNKKLKLTDIIPPYFFIVDEINRADLSRVFGELMYSLEYRGYEGKVKTLYSYLVDKNDQDVKFLYENESNYFFIPQNVYIIGTMNTIDRSVDSFDFALRRRFSWEEIEPDYDVIRENLNEKIADNIATSLKNLNDVIKEDDLLGPDYQIGHSYALNLLKQPQIKSSKTAKEFLWSNFIESLLQEYFRGLGESTIKIKELKDKFFEIGKSKNNDE